MWLIKAILILALVGIYYQDAKERLVYWFLFPIVALSAGLLFYFEALKELFFVSVLINLLFISVILSIVYLYATLKLKVKFWNVFGLGDVLLFFAMVGSFSSISFLVIFSSGLFFSLALYLITKSKYSTVPLAGYMSLFFGLTYLSYWSGFIQSVYQI